MNALKRIGLLALISLSLASVACTKITTGHVGLRTDFNGTIEQTPLAVGWHQTLVGSVHEYAANEITLELKELHPQTKDRTTLSDLDLTFTYAVLPTAIPDLVTRFKGRDMYLNNGDIYPLGLYISNVVQTATTDVLSTYNALDANGNRDEIKDKIKAQSQKILLEEKLSDVVRVHQVFIKNLDIAKELKASALAVISAQNDLATKTMEVRTAAKEAERLTALSANRQNIEYLNAQSMASIADGVKNGKVQTIIIPHNFAGLIQLPAKN